MKLRSAAMVVVLAATTGLAQETLPVSGPADTPIPVQRRMPPTRLRTSPLTDNKAAAVQGAGSLRQRLQDLETTVNSMHAVLVQMHASARAAKSKDPLVKADLDMWDLMVSHLDKEVQELKLAETAREDLEARRAAMYKQADAKAQAAARAANAAQQMRFGVMPGRVPANQTTNQSTTGQAAPTPAPAGQSSAPAATPESSPK